MAVKVLIKVLILLQGLGNYSVTMADNLGDKLGGMIQYHVPSSQDHYLALEIVIACYGLGRGHCFDRTI